MHWGLIGNPENRRVQFFLDAATEAKLPPVIVVSYRDLLTNTDASIEALRSVDYVRIESPGENREVENLILKRCSTMPVRPVTEHGEMGQFKAWYIGYQSLMAELSYAGIQTVNPAENIALMFDKLEAKEAMKKSADQIPLIPTLGVPNGLDEVLKIMTETKLPQVFIKTRYGSSAAGIIALRKRGNDLIFYTTMEAKKSGQQLRLYNNLKVRRSSSRKELESIIAAIAPQDLLLEPWVPKATTAGKAFDLRLFVCSGRVAHTVVRCSRSPLTNLHLGNERGNILAVRRWLGPKRWEEICCDTVNAVRAMGLDTFYAGVDVLISPDGKKHYIIEVNAFGDLLPGLTFEGMNTYSLFLHQFEKTKATMS